MEKINKFVIGSLAVAALLQPTGVFALTKSEAIYSNLNVDGSSYNSIVTNRLSDLSVGEEKDQTELKELLNINGNEKFNLNGNKLTWDAKGKDIFYRGTTKEELPITTKITYYLDNKLVEPKDIVGKSGKVRIEINFKNNDANIVNINGINETLYTPFVVTVGTVLSENDSNISITNGKSVNTGSKNMIVGIAAPGLYKSMDLSELKNLDSITIKYTTESFKLNNMYIVSTPKLLSNADLSVFNKMDKLSADIDELQVNMDAIEKGVSTLGSGISQLSSGSSDLTTNIKTAYDNVKLLNSGATKVDGGLQAVLTSLKTAQDKLGDSDVEGSISQLTELKKANSSTITKLSASIAEDTVLGQTYVSQHLDVLSEEDIMALPVDNNTKSSLITAKRTYEANDGIITLLKTNNIAIDSTITNLTGISNEIGTLIIELSKGLTTIKDGSYQVSNGLDKLEDGMNKLYGGAYTFSTKMNEANDGVKDLVNGVSKFNDEGINKLSDYSNTFKIYGERAKALVNLSKKYNGFASDNSDETVFVSMVNSVK